MSFMRTDHWRSAVVRAPVEEIIRAGTFDGFSVKLLPDIGDHRYLATPFGLCRKGKLYIFAESFDYRTARGVIEVLVYDSGGQMLHRQEVLQERWHLSYPFIFEHDGETFMLPEAHESGQLSLYRARAFPYEWERVEAFHFPVGAINATPFFHAGKWWLFWTPPGIRIVRYGSLHFSVADSLTGPWKDLGLVLYDPAGARAGGTPFLLDGRVFLPTQDCRRTYGGGLRLLEIEGLERELPRVVPRQSLEIPSKLKKQYSDGMHTFSSAGPVTLIDVKKIGFGLRRHMMNIVCRPL